MSHQYPPHELHHKLWMLVRKNNKLFSQKRRLEEFRIILGYISKSRSLDDLVVLMTLFIFANDSQKELIEELCLPWLRELPCDEFPKLDERLRSSIQSTGWLGTYTPRYATKPTVFELCILACDPSGYTRERAIVALAKHVEPMALSLALIRCNDWVTPIRISARDTAVSLIASLELAELLSVWNMFARVSLGQRHGDVGLKNTLFPMLQKRVPSKMLHRQLCSGDSRTRRYAAEVMWENHLKLNFADLQALCTCSDPFICFRTMRTVLPKMDQAIRIKLLDLVKKKKWAPARLERLRLLIVDDPDGIKEELVDALCDRSPSVRNFARFHLKECDGIDAENHYLTKLKSNNTSCRIAALHGLNEINSPLSAQITSAWLHDKNPRVTAASLFILPVESINAQEELILEKITDTSPHVSKAAYTALCKNPPLAEKILPYLHKKNLSIRHAIYFANLLMLQSRWESVAHSIWLCRHPKQEVRQAGASWLESWIYGKRTFWIQPSNSDLERIHAELDHSKSSITNRLAEEIRFFVSSYK